MGGSGALDALPRRQQEAPVGPADRAPDEGAEAAVADLPAGERGGPASGLATLRISTNPRLDEAASALPLAPVATLPPPRERYLLTEAAGGVAAFPPAPRAEVSTLAVVSVVALLLGPLGAVAAIVFGWAARREIDDAPSRRAGYGMATAGLALGLLLTLGWGAALALGAWTWTYERGALAMAQEPEATVAPAAQESAPPAPAGGPTGPHASVPARTALQRIGALTVVDVGVEVRTLGEELARQRAAAFAQGERLLVMTTREECSACRSIDRALSNPLLQTALRGVRLVRVDTDVFKEDLDELRIPCERTPGFFLPSLDLAPQDGIFGGEWDKDTPESIAPVLGAFVRGQHGSRRQPWKPLPGSGVRL